MVPSLPLLSPESLVSVKEISDRKKTLIITAHDREHASREVLSFLKTIIQEKYTFTEEKKVKKDVSKKEKKKRKFYKYAIGQLIFGGTLVLASKIKMLLSINGSKMRTFSKHLFQRTEQHDD